MKNKIFGSILGIGMLFASAAPGIAANRVEFIDTGFLSNNKTTIRNNRSLNVTNNQTANVTNDIESESETGENSYILNNKVLGPGGTGNATSNVTVTNLLNYQDTNIQGCGCEGDNEAIIDQTGPLSNNEIVINNDQNVTVSNNQEGRVTNLIKSEAETGENSYFGNTKVDGVGKTGNASSTVTVINDLNTSFTTINF